MKKSKRRDPRHDPEEGDVLKDPEGFYLYVTARSSRTLWVRPFGDKKPGLWCSHMKLGFWRQKSQGL